MSIISLIRKYAAFSIIIFTALIALTFVLFLVGNQIGEKSENFAMVTAAAIIAGSFLNITSFPWSTIISKLFANMGFQGWIIAAVISTYINFILGGILMGLFKYKYQTKSKGL